MLSLIGGKVWGYLIAAGAFLLVIGGGLLKAFSAGRTKERAKQQEKVIEKTTEGKRARRDADPDELSRFDR